MPPKKADGKKGAAKKDDPAELLASQLEAERQDLVSQPTRWFTDSSLRM